MPTIKQIADELHVSKTTISKVIAQLNLCVVKKGNRIELTEEQAETIKSQITQSGDLQKMPEEPTIEPKITQKELQTTLIEALQSQINILTEQLTVKDNQIVAQQEQIQALTESLQSTITALTAAQALHAGTMQASLTSGEMPPPASEQDSPVAPELERKGWRSKFWKKTK